LCDVWSSKLSFPGNRGQNETYVYELYVSNVILKCLLTEIDRVQFIDHFLILKSIRNIDQSSDQVEFFAPIAAYLTNTRVIY